MVSEHLREDLPALPGEFVVHDPPSVPVEPATPAALAQPDRLPPLSRAAEARRQKVLAMLARPGCQYAVCVEDPNTDPLVMTVGTPGGVREVSIPQGRYDPFEVLEKVYRWDTGRAGS
jgi:hypothetical protein